MKSQDSVTQHQVEAKTHPNGSEIANSIDIKDWQQVTVGNDRSSFMRCGGGSWCNEPK